MALFPTIESSEAFEAYRARLEPWLPGVEAILSRENMPTEDISLFEKGGNPVFGIGPSVVLKLIAPSFEEEVLRERLALEALRDFRALPIPRWLGTGTLEGWTYILLSRLDGLLLEDLWPEVDAETRCLLLHDVGSVMAVVHAVPTDGLAPIEVHWPTFLREQTRAARERHSRFQTPPFVLDSLESYCESVLAEVEDTGPNVLLTGEYTPMNLLVRRESNSELSLAGMFDFGDSMVGAREYDLLGPLCFLCEGSPVAVKAFLDGYGYDESQRNHRTSRRLLLYLLLHRYANLDVQVRLPHSRWREEVGDLDELASVLFPL